MKKIFFALLLFASFFFGISISDYVINNDFRYAELKKINKTTVKKYTTLYGNVHENGQTEIMLKYPFKVLKIYKSINDNVYNGEKIAEVDVKEYINNYLSENINQADDNIISYLNEYSGNVESPVNGIIRAVNIREGDRANIDSPAFLIVSNDNLIIKSKIDINNLSEIFVGQKAFVLKNNNVCNATVIDIEASEETNEENSFISFSLKPYSNNILAPGDNVRIELNDRPYENVIIIPLNCIDYFKDDKFVYVDTSGFALKRIVKTGKIIGDNIIIEHGLNEGDILISEPGKYNINSGKKICDF